MQDKCIVKEIVNKFLETHRTYAARALKHNGDIDFDVKINSKKDILLLSLVSRILNDYANIPTISSFDNRRRGVKDLVNKLDKIISECVLNDKDTIDIHLNDLAMCTYYLGMVVASLDTKEDHNDDTKMIENLYESE